MTDNFSEEEKKRIDIVGKYNFFSSELNEKILRSCFHDLKNLICGISMFAELIALNVKDEKCGKIINTAWKSQEIIKSLQNYTFCYEAEIIYNVNGYIENFFNLIPHVKEFSSVKYVINLSPSLPSVYGNRYLFQQALCVVSSLLSENGKVHISSCLEENNVVISIVSDDWTEDFKDFKDSKESEFCREVATLHKGTFGIIEKAVFFSIPAHIDT